jgi:ribosomal protein S18 acetylase RimI-like enzyme
LTVELRLLHRGDEAAIKAAQNCFDHAVKREWAAKFLASPGHHILLAYCDGSPAGFVTGVEMTHPDKGTEMFLYELAVDEPFRRRGVGAALVRALADLARQHGCYGMWVLTDDDNIAALATYRAAGGAVGETNRMIEWRFGRQDEAGG